MRTRLVVRFGSFSSVQRRCCRARTSFDSRHDSPLDRRLVRPLHHQRPCPTGRPERGPGLDGIGSARESPVRRTRSNPQLEEAYQAKWRSAKTPVVAGIPHLIPITFAPRQRVGIRTTVRLSCQKRCHRTQAIHSSKAPGCTRNYRDRHDRCRPGRK
jgi:hypothetical protein